MKKIILVVSLFLIPVFCFAAKEAKPALESGKVVKGSEVVVDSFEGEKIKWIGITFIAAKEGGQEQTVEDIIKLDLNKDTKYVKKGKQSLRVEYTAKPVSEDKFAMISTTSAKPTGDNNIVSFWIYKVKGKANLSLVLFYPKRTSIQMIPLDFEGWKEIKLTSADFTAVSDWNKVSIVQIVIKGDATFYLDDLKFMKAGK